MLGLARREGDEHDEADRAYDVMSDPSDYTDLAQRRDRKPGNGEAEHRTGGDGELMRRVARI